MKFLSAATLLAATPLLCSAASLPSIFDSSQALLGGNTADAVPVEGDNPLVYCNDPSDYLLTIDHVDLVPNPPLPGQKLKITAKGTFGEKIDKGAYVNLEVKYGFITLIRQTADLCDQLGNVDMKCPLEKGQMVLTKEVDLPKQIPPGKYSVLADVYTKSDEQVTCLRANNIEFKAQF
ncbi:hypothetical protein N7493_003429 [Penicillium malachiteum]|uniref:Phosphatidylglycerol/phosphatidylinositol transfer protein n=1 Tax=Penicillium malachiteum TaxID=1324776 RepID=A0AAD6HQK9_9EURO|nr:hypothetical protein N7493_003429 [Penicillium malachiteum]